MAEPLRLNIIVDPDLFPDIYADYMRLKKIKKRVDGSRLLHLATIGLMVSKNGSINPDVAPQEEIEPAPVVSKPEISSNQKNEVKAPGVPLMDEDELEDLENVLSGNFVSSS